ncbi:cytochrome c oxidase accessory protein CcoG [Denitromonas sp.]|uniref:cytochrome c oxidase accessory protein CcoG n=1 Tax=Denitromonas sp. TaxID=2734609 RepID=UPI003A8B8C79
MTVATITFHRHSPPQIHPRETAGRYNRLRWAMVWFSQVIFYGTCWLRWDDRQAVLFDIAGRKAYLFGLVLWPQDALLLAWVLVLAATALFFVTALAGRVFCGFACPQTVYTAIFRWIEARIEGDHLARARLDAAPWGPAKLARRGSKFALWALVAGWTGITFVGYFTPMQPLLTDLAAGAPGPWAGAWIVGYALFTFVLAGFAREMVCLHMCPYARFQGVMFDADTLTIGYDQPRGEPRRPRGARQAEPAGDCVACNQCVQVCPTGIDIRDGLQYQCINCGLCADACDTVMTHVGAPTGLIRMMSAQPGGQAAHGYWREIARRLRTPRALAYLAVMAAVSLAMAWQLATRVPLQLDVLRDRQSLAREASDGRIENSYTLRLLNMRETARSVAIEVRDLPGGVLIGPAVQAVEAGRVSTVSITVTAPPGEHRQQPLRLQLRALDGSGDRAEAASVFFNPR